MDLLSSRRAGGHRPIAGAGLVLVLALGLGLSCGAVVDGAYRGTPLFSFDGQLVQYEALPDQGLEFRATLLWLPDPSTDPATQRPRLDRAVEQPAVSVEVRFPSTFRVDVFAPPEERMLIPGTGLGMALVIVFEDRDGDGRVTLSGEAPELVGGAPFEVLVYARDGAAAASAGERLGQPIVPGFQLLRLPLLCSADTGLAECETPLGAACARDRDCGAEGVCLMETAGVTWPQGACALRLSTVTCLLPDDVGYYLGEVEDYAIQGCLEDRECRAGYRCDDFAGGCVPEDGPAFPVPFSAKKSLRDCEVPLGASCRSESDCMGGVCLTRSNGEFFPGGYCVLTVEAAEREGCEPEDGIDLPWDFRADGASTHWFLACDSDSECRSDQGYFCDPWYGACMPRSPLALELSPDFAPPAVCVGRFAVE